VYNKLSTGVAGTCTSEKTFSAADVFVDNLKPLRRCKSLQFQLALCMSDCSSLMCGADWMRIGAFCLDSGEAVASAQLSELKSFCEDGEVGSSSSMAKFHVVHNVKKGIWIAGDHLYCTYVWLKWSQELKSFDSIKSSILTADFTTKLEEININEHFTI